MKVVLLKNVENLGKEGDIKEVADGFARNYLIPNNLAQPATQSAVEKAKKNSEVKAEEAENKLHEIQETAQMLDGREVVIKAKSQDGKLFGAISAESIVKELAKESIKIKKENVVLENPIKELGEYEVKIQLEDGIEVMIKVVIEEE